MHKEFWREVKAQYEAGDKNIYKLYCKLGRVYAVGYGTLLSEWRHVAPKHNGLPEPCNPTFNYPEHEVLIALSHLTNSYVPKFKPGDMVKARYSLVTGVIRSIINIDGSLRYVVFLLPGCIVHSFSCEEDIDVNFTLVESTAPPRVNNTPNVEDEELDTPVSSTPVTGVTPMHDFNTKNPPLLIPTGLLNSVLMTPSQALALKIAGWGVNTIKYTGIGLWYLVKFSPVLTAAAVAIPQTRPSVLMAGSQLLAWFAK